MRIDPSTLKSRSVFPTDAIYQHWCGTLFERYKLNDGYSYSISVDTGVVSKGKKMKLTDDKISKSDQP